MSDQRKIVTEHVYPPIPIRRFDWAAHYDDPEGPSGWGPTEADAIADLLDNHPRGGGPTVEDPDRPYCKPDQSCCDFCCGN